METINFNGKEYVLKEEFDKLKLDDNNFKSGFKFLSNGCNIMDEANVMALGHFKIDGGFIATKISISYLEKAIKILKQMSLNKNSYSGDYLSLAYKKDFPMIIGRINDDGEAIGIVIAPRVDD